MSKADDLVVIVGAGLAGLTCARRLQQAGRSVLVVEAADDIGGRVRTDVVDGFRLDRGFQVLLTAYPAAKEQFDYASLRLKPYVNGSLIRHNGRFHRFIDPWRHPLDGLKSAFGGVGSLTDKLKIASLRRQSRKGTLTELFEQPEQTTAAVLKEYGFSDHMIDAFFRPFLGGVFLERELRTSSRVLHFVFRMFSMGDISVPALGMQELPKQIAADLKDGCVRLNTPVAAVSPSSVTLQNGETIQAARVVLATNALAAGKLLSQDVSDEGRHVRCLYFSCLQPPVNEPILVLNGDGDGPINNLSVPSLVSPHYAPDGQHLISISVTDPAFVSDNELQARVLQQATDWFGSEAVHGWKFIADYDIPQALPNQLSGSGVRSGHAKTEDEIIICGDHVGNASIQSALESGLHAASMING